MIKDFRKGGGVAWIDPASPKEHQKSKEGKTGSINRYSCTTTTMYCHYGQIGVKLSKITQDNSFNIFTHCIRLDLETFIITTSRETDGTSCNDQKTTKSDYLFALNRLDF